MFDGHGSLIQGDRHYEGGWRFGRRQGYGIQTYGDGSYYIGDWYEGNAQGQGTYWEQSGYNHTGAWHKGDQTGFGTSTYPDGTQ